MIGPEGTLKRFTIQVYSGDFYYNDTVYDQVQLNMRFDGTFGVAGRVKGTETYEAIKY